MRRRAKVDSNHREIVEALRKAGWKVLSLAAVGKGVPDLLVHKDGPFTRLVEVKTTKGKLTEDQRTFQRYGWPVTIVRSVDDALNLF